MLSRIVLALVVGIVVWLVCVFVGDLLLSVAGPSFLAAVGSFLKAYAALIGLLAALWYYFAGGRV